MEETKWDKFKEFLHQSLLFVLSSPMIMYHIIIHLVESVQEYHVEWREALFMRRFGLIDDQHVEDFVNWTNCYKDRRINGDINVIAMREWDEPVNNMSDMFLLLEAGKILDMTLGNGNTIQFKMNEYGTIIKAFKDREGNWVVEKWGPTINMLRQSIKLANIRLSMDSWAGGSKDEFEKTSN